MDWPISHLAVCAGTDADELPPPEPCAKVRRALQEYLDQRTHDPLAILLEFGLVDELRHED